MKAIFWIGLKDGTRLSRSVTYTEDKTDDELDEAMQEWASERLPELDAKGLVGEGCNAGVDIISKTLSRSAGMQYEN